MDSGETLCPGEEHVAGPPLCLTPTTKSVLVGKIQDAAVHLDEGSPDLSKVEELLVLLLGKKTTATACLTSFTIFNTFTSFPILNLAIATRLWPA